MRDDSAEILFHFPFPCGRPLWAVLTWAHPHHTHQIFTQKHLTQSVQCYFSSHKHGISVNSAWTAFLGDWHCQTAALRWNTLRHSPQRSATDADILGRLAETSEVSKVLSFKPGVGQNIALHASPTARKSSAGVPAFLIHSIWKRFFKFVFWWFVLRLGTAIWQHAAHTIDQLSSPGCRTRAIPKCWSVNEKNIEEIYGKSKYNGSVGSKKKKRKKKRQGRKSRRSSHKN